MPTRLPTQGHIFQWNSSLERGFAPIMFRDWLPRDIRRKAQPGTPIRELLDAWTEAIDEVRAEGSLEPK